MQYLTWEGKYTLSIPLTTPPPKCLIGRENDSEQQLLKISLGSYCKLLMRNWAMKSDMGYDYVLLGYRRKTTLR